MESKNTIKTMCRICGEECGISLALSNGRIVDVQGMKEHPTSKGALCPKGKALIDYVYAPDRILYPLLKENDSWKQIGWDEAINICVKKLKEIEQVYGPKSVAFLTGEGVGHFHAKWVLQRFADVYRSPNVFSVGSLCFHSRVIGHYLALGMLAMADYENSNCIVFWGSNPFNSRPPTQQVFNFKREKGAKFITIDPIKHDLAKLSDLYLQIIPGTDCVLALGIINHLLNESRYDREFADKYILGLEELREHAKVYTLDVVERITGISRGEIIKFFEMISNTKPMTILAGSGIDHSLCGVDTHRAICGIQALTGNIGNQGGYVFPPRLKLKNIRLPDRLGGEKPIGGEAFPFYWHVYREGQGILLFDSILKESPYPIKALFVQGANPILTWPNTKKTREALSKVFLVVQDVFQTDTTKVADLILPASTTFEKHELRDYGNFGVPVLMLRRIAIDPIPQSISSDVFWLKLARAMGFEELMPWENETDIIKELMQPTGIGFEQLASETNGIIYERSKKAQDSLSFSTPSRKIEVYSDRMQKKGFNPLPSYIEPPQPTEEYPLILCTGARKVEFQHSRLRNIKKLRERSPDPLAELSGKTADRYGIKDEDLVYIKTNIGKIRIKAHINHDVRDNVISILHGWEGNGNVNELIPDRDLDPISGFPNLKSIPCMILKA